MPSVIDQRSSIDRTVKIFDAFYANDLRVGADQYDLVYGYFTSVCATKSIAANFAAVLFRIAQQSGIDVITLLQQLQGSNNKLAMNQVLCYYLNSIKNKTSLYGVGLVPLANQPVARNVVQ